METGEQKAIIPVIGLGTCNMKDDKVEEVVYQSIKDGVRLIDTASRYENEEGVGKGINKAIKEGIVKREDLFVVTKFWLNEKEDPEKALKASLQRLNLSYVDLYLDHWPTGKDYNGNNNFKLICVRDYWPKVEKLVTEGLTKALGVSNYNVQNLLIVLSVAKIKPIVNEVEFHPYLYQKDLLEFCNLENIRILAYNPLVKGAYCKERHQKEMDSLKLDLFNEPAVQTLVGKYGKTPGQIILNWEIKRGVIPIPGTTKPERMKENLEAVNLKMEDAEYETLDKFAELGKEFRFCDSEKIYGIDIFA
jgi:D-xylose reductase